MRAPAPRRLASAPALMLLSSLVWAGCASNIPESGMQASVDTLGLSMAQLAGEIRELSARINLLAAQMPDDPRWRAEYLMAESVREARLDTLETGVGAMAKAISQLASQLESGNLTVDIRSLRQIQETILRLEARISTERESVMTAFDRHRIDGFIRMRGLIDTTVARTPALMIPVVDHAAWRTLQILGAVFVGAFVFTLVIRLTGRAEKA